jgi:ectoine hydroxylase-related dioxygenase (phytanoyl-CoA dioxygenase family)
VEGDFIVFPSHIIHRSGVNQTEKRRSIISFNFDVKDIRDDLLAERTIKYVY